MEQPYSGLTAQVKVNGVLVGYINGCTLNLEKNIVTVNAFGSYYSKKLPAVKNWTASIDGTAAFAAGDSQHKLVQAYESGEEVTFTFELSPSVYFQGNALIGNLTITGNVDDAITISGNVEGSGGVAFNLPELVNVTIRSGVGGTTSPAGVLRAAKGEALAITCLPAAGKVADKYGLNGATPSVAITSNAFSITPSADTTVEVTFTDAE